LPCWTYFSALARTFCLLNPNNAIECELQTLVFQILLFKILVFKIPVFKYKIFTKNSLSVGEPLLHTAPRVI
jgi:hypothetical protein